MFESLPCWRLGAWLQPDSQGTLAAVDRQIRYTTGNTIPPSVCTRRSDGFWPRTESPRKADRNKSDHTTNKWRRCGGGTAYGPFNTYIPIRSTTIGKSRVARDPIAMHTSWRSNSDITSVTSIGYPRMRASGESSTTKHRLLHASGPHPIPPPNDSKMLELEDERVTPVYLISLLGSVSHYERCYYGFTAGHGVDPAGSALGGG
ncbi:carbonic anhydrase [Dorcoceras hygrometricum]|uniref:Carbonic anhydrase n=1 Tax=Dorcoceras hygrometricum TaxID=472368 RepID=A0A2Z7AX96_9LAMI|nr:carbonic anhydrase [Dorcoceras hygrometricum]